MLLVLFVCVFWSCAVEEKFVPLTDEEVAASLEEAGTTADRFSRDRVAVLSRERVSDAVMNFATRCRLREGHTFDI